MEIIDENEELDGTPMGRRTSNFFDFDHHFDSVSAFSESTIADSDFVSQRIRKFENDRNHDDKRNSNKQSHIYNLSIDKVVINGAQGETEIEKPVKAAVDQIVADLNRSPEKYKLPSVENKSFVKKALTSSRLIVPFLIIVVVIISVSIAVPLILSQKDDNNLKDIDTTSTSTISTSTTTGNLYPTSRPTTPAPEFTDKVKLVKRSAWLSKGLNVNGKYKQLKPVKKIVVLSTMTDDCYDEASCIDFLAEHQQNAYPEFEDVRENFFVTDGAVYEGRGFPIEGQTTFASQTSYNNKAVSISFIIRVNETTPSLKQQESFCRFINQSIEQKDLNETFSLFHHSDLVSSTIDDANDDFSFETCELHARKPPSVIKRRDWNAFDFPTDGTIYFRTFSSNVIIGSTKGQSCDTRKACSELLMEWQKLDEIRYNFIFSETDDLIFEGTSFDVVVQPEFSQALRILYLGSFEFSEALMKRINEFLEFAVKIDKLSENYRLQVDCQESNSTELLEMLRSDSHFDVDFQCT